MEGWVALQEANGEPVAMVHQPGILISRHEKQVDD